MTETIRIDRWLWAARFYKTRSLATEMVNTGRVQHNDSRTKASRMVKTGDELSISRGTEEFIIHIIALADKRGSAAIAQSLYEETPASIAARQKLAEQRKLDIETSPAPAKRPDKKARRQIIRFQKIHD